MALALRLLLLLGAAALPGGRSRLHSTRIYNTVVSEPGPGLPWYSAAGYVDDQLFVDYTSEKRRVEPHTEWMARNVDPQHWDEQTWRARRWQAWFNASLNTLRELYNHNKGFHVIQTIYGCDLREDGVIQGFYQDSYDGRDFLTFDKETMTWVAADIGAQITKKRWDVEIGDNQRWKRYLEEECIPWLRSSLEYGKETLQRKEPNNNLIPIVAGVITAVVLIGVIIGVVVWKKKRPGKKGDGYTVAPENDQGSSGSDLSAKA
ncbi:H-2 class I histocompatibility antigen, Q9 alpha chain-like isoform X2 [Natator depressus]|uniref:H-2 class I histocompatibility antigen, Q9 alpha chain-like isoform X2 n=1 Tax=Natator depressus TaxID=27790 RepID=UPI003EBE9ED1